MRELRSGTGPFVELVASSMAGLVLLGLAVGGAPRGLFYLGVAFSSIAAALAVLIVLAFRRRKRLAHLVRSGQADWASDCLIPEGDSAVPGVHQYAPPPGPKGVLTLTGTTRHWTPDPSTARKGYEEMTIDVASCAATYEGRSRDLSGFTVDTWSFPVGGIRLRLQLILQTSDLQVLLK